ncbi:hypothetical protein [Flavitalea sp.]|nr:hypothetical protein [Flavitalea sp.]
MKSIILLPLIAFVLAVSVQAQQATGRLDIKLNKNIFKPGDSLFVTVDYKDGGGQILNQSLATLELVIENEEGQRTRLRWPVIKGQASGAIFLPDSLPLGKYTLLAGLQQRFFEVIGQVKDARNIGSIKAMLLTKAGDWDEQEVTVAPDGTFTIRNWLFEDNALLAFQGTKDNNQSLNISISSQLDSSYEPLAVAGRTFYIGNPPAAVRPNLDKPVETHEAIFADRGSVLPAVIVKGTVKTPAQQFNEEHVRGLFRSGDERLISIMDDPSAMGFTNVFNYLQGRVAGLQIAPTGVARWRGSPVTFFLDEVRVSAQQIANIPMTDIAIVKAYPPPFIGAQGGGGGVAIYTRRGGEANYLPANRQVFKVRGYTPSATALDMNKLSM